MYYVWKIGIKKMTTDYSREGLMNFHTYLANKGLMNSNTVAARKAAANKMLAVLDEVEAKDLRAVDLDAVASRFFNLNKNEFTPDSLTTYKSRLKSAVDDFIKHTDNPASFKPQASKTRNLSVAKPDTANKNGTENTNQKGNNSNSQQYDNSFPIPIRDGIQVKLVGIPADLTRREAQKISNVVMALSLPDDDSKV